MMMVMMIAMWQEGGGEARGLTMIKLFSVKQKQKEAAESANGRPIKKQSAGELRVQKGPVYFHCPFAFISAGLKRKGFSRGERMYSVFGIRLEFPSILGLYLHH
jgi:hypothetical protein